MRVGAVDVLVVAGRTSTWSASAAAAPVRSGSSATCVTNSRTWASGSAPMNPGMSCPCHTTNTVGMLWIWNAWDSRGLASVSTVASTQAPSASSASRSRIGDSCLQGPHQVAQKSMTTGTAKDRSTTSLWKVASVTTVTGSASRDLAGGRRACGLRHGGLRLLARGTLGGQRAEVDGAVRAEARTRSGGRAHALILPDRAPPAHHRSTRPRSSR